ncbi:MAG TPA: extracellular solute-binding protein [candidate division Zixibacteria bacterium]|nr:extracellular solute-binding protein [candidate division Zixibacteria bacterium]
MNRVALRVSSFLRKRKRALAGAVAFVACAAGGAMAQDARAKAEAEGKMVFYASFNANDSKTLIDGFKQLYPKIDATFYRATDAQLMERILTEARAGRHLWDVVMATSFYGHNLKKRGLLAPYDSPERKFYREGYKDPQATWTSIYTNYAAFGYNTRQVAKAAVPKSLHDLLRPEWQGNLGIDSRAYEWFGTMLKAMGEEKGLAYMRELARQVQLRNGRTLIAQLVAAGEFKGALSAYSQTFEQLKPAGAPVDWLYLDPVFANIHPMGLAAKAPHPNAGKLFIDFVLSKRGQELIRGMNRIPDRIDTPPEQKRLMEGIKPAFAPVEVFENFERYAKLFHEVFGGR